MDKVMCPNGHSYDKSESDCPQCGLRGLPQAKIPPTMAAPSIGRSTVSHGTPIPVDRSGRPGRTISVQQLTTKMDPVVGWLVCVAGPNKGRDYRLHSDRNTIGRSPNMDVCIEGDDTVSGENHAQVVYSTRSKSFNLVPGTGRNLVYLNGDDLLMASPLKPYDRIDIGMGSFMFVPFCTPTLDWATLAVSAPDTNSQ